MHEPDKEYSLGREVLKDVKADTALHPSAPLVNRMVPPAAQFSAGVVLF